MSNALLKLTSDNAAVLAIDFQERLLPAIDGAEACIAAAGRLLAASQLLGLPMLATEQYPAGLGHTVPAIRQALGNTALVEKVRFSACVCDVLDRLRQLDRPCVLIVGIEAHVCVQQSVLDLLREGYTPFICADAVSSRRPLDRETALARMRQAGAVVTTTESAIFEILGEAGTDRFKQVLKIVK